MRDRVKLWLGSGSGSVSVISVWWITKAFADRYKSHSFILLLHVLYLFISFISFISSIIIFLSVLILHFPSFSLFIYQSCYEVYLYVYIWLVRRVEIICLRHHWLTLRYIYINLYTYIHIHAHKQIISTKKWDKK